MGKCCGHAQTTRNAGWAAARQRADPPMACAPNDHHIRLHIAFQGWRMTMTDVSIHRETLRSLPTFMEGLGHGVEDEQQSDVRDDGRSRVDEQLPSIREGEVGPVTTQTTMLRVASRKAQCDPTRWAERSAMARNFSFIQAPWVDAAMLAAALIHRPTSRSQASGAAITSSLKVRGFRGAVARAGLRRVANNGKPWPGAGLSRASPTLTASGGPPRLLPHLKGTLKRVFAALCRAQRVTARCSSQGRRS